MARITRVRRAQQRYATKPVLDAEGHPVRTPVMARNGQPKVTKKGRPVYVTKTERDLTKPLPMPTCDYCGEKIAVGSAYMWIAPKSGPYGGRKMYRHATHPTWNVWDYSSSMSAQLARISHDAFAAVSDVESPDDVQSILDDAAQAIRDLAEEKRSSASNIEEGFGHETYQSTELNETADALDGWADEIEGATIPDLPDPDEVECCSQPDCENCGGTGGFTPDDPTDDQMDEWRSEVEDMLAIVDESPV